MRVVWSAKARRDLRRSYQNRAGYSVDSARSLLRSIRERGRQLADFPDSGRVAPEFGTPLVRELVEAEHRILYERFPDRVVVIAVAHGRRSLEEDPTSRN